MKKTELNLNRNVKAGAVLIAFLSCANDLNTKYSCLMNKMRYKYFSDKRKLLHTLTYGNDVIF